MENFNPRKYIVENKVPISRKVSQEAVHDTLDILRNVVEGMLGGKELLSNKTPPTSQIEIDAGTAVKQTMIQKIQSLQGAMKNHSKFLVNGQGVVIFKISDYMKAELKTCKGDGLIFLVKDKKMALSICLDDSEQLLVLKDSILNKELNPCQAYATLLNGFDSINSSCWLCLDSYHGRISFGIGEVRKETERIYSTLEDCQRKCSHEIIDITSYGGSILEVYRDPIIYKVPLVIIEPNLYTLEMAATHEKTIPSNLPPECLKLYNSISGSNFVINSPDFPEFADAISQSINDPNGWCYKTLKEKASEFGDENFDATYLRITLGTNQGNSPGVPYVLEIWPSGHFSPIHNHAGANAITKVLYGGIMVELYSYFSVKNQKPFAIQEFKQGDITWISPSFNQTHRVINVSPTVCITIQCYIYNNDDSLHYEYFDYIENDGKSIGHFDPNSDMDFIDFKIQMKKEWEAKKL